MERIIVPYIFFSVISSIAEIIVGRANPETELNGPVWFLQTLFCALCIYYVLSIFAKGIRLDLICLAIALSAFFVFKFTDISTVLAFHLYRALVSMCFIHLGKRISNIYKTSDKRQTSLIGCVCLLVFIASYYVSIDNYHVEGLGFVSGSIFTYHILYPYLLAISGSIVVLCISKLLGSVRWLNWMGRNSLVILCVHFPFLERLIVFSASSPLYHSTMGKIVLAVGAQMLVVAVCVLLVNVCKRFVPQLTGYRKTFLTETS